MQLLTKNVVITSVINDPANFRIFPILVRFNFIVFSLFTIHYSLFISEAQRALSLCQGLHRRYHRNYRPY